MTSAYPQLFEQSQRVINSEAACDQHLLLLAKLGLARACWRMGDALAARRLAQEALQLSRDLRQPELEANTLCLLAVSSEAVGEYQQTLELETAALSLQRNAGQPRSMAVSLCNLSTTFYSLGNFGRAVEVLNEALKLFLQPGDRRGEGNCLGNLATAYAALGETARAEALQKAALDLRRELGDRRGEAISLGNLAGICRARGDLAAACELEEQSLQVFRLIADRYGEAHSLCNLGGIAFLQGRLGLAIQQLASSLALRQEIADRPGIAFTCIVASAPLASLGRLHEACNVLNGGSAACAALGYQLEPCDEIFVAAARECLDRAASAGTIAAGQLEAWQAEGRAMSIEELGRFTSAGLHEAAQTAQNQSAAAQADQCPADA